MDYLDEKAMDEMLSDDEGAGEDGEGGGVYRTATTPEGRAERLRRRQMFRAVEEQLEGATPRHGFSTRLSSRHVNPDGTPGSTGGQHRGSVQ